ncbi:hypothetical protein GZH47_26940 [Paenibacillus rhizovicinus]|uniref:Uncharacterized protein n=1 Tax=Paenibacillus rhizovicinus TaxID=2704463 RepID=A0A6C0P685_9BACL|nr:hypothetical protein [Paenibacillus rhizovicinus]QHW34070.1 hypothetical protein GZH47_26940 [Paenibacillus rhizovicinus]
MRKWFMFAGVLVVLLSGCGAEEHTNTAATGNPERQAGVQLNEMPSEMPDDFDFKVRYGYGMKDEIDTYENTVTKDLIVKGSATADLVFSDSEMRTIYAKMKAINIMQLKELNPINPGCGQIPYDQASWTITIAGETKTLTWSGEHCSLTASAKKLLELQTYIAGIVRATDAYKAMPAAEGGYD